MHIENCLWAQVAVLEIYWTILHCLGQDMQVLDKFCIWVELPVQRRLPDFLKVASGNPTSTCIPRVDG